MCVEEKRKLAQLFLAVSKHPSPVEVSVIPMEYIEPWEHPARYDFHFSEDHRSRMEGMLVGSFTEKWNKDVLRDEDLAAHIKLTRHRGIALIGPPSSDVFPSVPEVDFIDSVLADILSPEFGLNPKSDIPVYMILNACRTLAYLQTRQCLSKDEGGVWASDTLPDQYHSLISGALNIYRGNVDGHEFPSTLLGKFVTDVRSEIINQSSGLVPTQSELVELNISGADRGSNDQPDKEHQ
jgi:streptomycin 3"-adenylyltransferase